MTTTEPQMLPRYLLGQTACSGYDYRGGADAVLVTITESDLQRWLTRMETVQQLMRDAPDITQVLERDPRPVLFADEIRLALELECEDDWYEITAVEHAALAHLIRDWMRGPRIEGLSACYSADAVYWTMYIAGTDIEITTPTLSCDFLAEIAGVSPSSAGLMPAVC